MTPEDTALAATTSRMLGAAQVPLVASGALAAIALFVIAFGARTTLAWWSIVALSLPALWVGMRARFDAGLFRDLARDAGSVGLPQRLGALDAALATIGLRRRNDSRPLEDRARGARKLVQWQALIAALQLGIALVATWPRR